MSGPLLSGEAYREAVVAAIADGWRFASLHATSGRGRLRGDDAAHLAGG